MLILTCSVSSLSDLTVTVLLVISSSPKINACEAFVLLALLNLALRLLSVKSISNEILELAFLSWFAILNANGAILLVELIKTSFFSFKLETDDIDINLSKPIAKPIAGIFLPPRVCARLSYLPPPIKAS